MIISHQFKFIFIKTRKTAGTSIELFLSPFCGENDVITPIWPAVESHRPQNYHGLWNPVPELIAKRGRNWRKVTKNLLSLNKFYNHIPAAVVKQRISREVWNSYFKFCVDRNPWDKTLSHYHMINDRSGGELSLSEYMKKGHFCLNYGHYCNSDGALLVDRVIKYEYLSDELGDVFNALGIPFDGSLGVKAKSEYRRDRRPYREVLSLHQKAKIEKAFAREIQLHGYQY